MIDEHAEMRKVLAYFEDRYGREPDAEDQADMDRIIAMVPKALREYWIGREMMREIEAEVHQEVLAGRMEIAGVDEDGELIYITKETHHD